MKKIICFLLLCCLLSVIQIGCNKKAEPEFSKVEFQSVPKRVQNFIEKNSGKNGVYLYDDNNSVNYLFLNASNLRQGEKAGYFEEIKYNIKDNSLDVCFNEEFTDDYTKKLDNRLLYKFKSSKRFDTIKVFKNGKIIPFDVVGS